MPGYSGGAAAPYRPKQLRLKNKPNPKPRYGKKQVTDDDLAGRTAQRRNALLRMGIKPKVSAGGLDTTTGGEARAIKRQLRNARAARNPITTPPKPGRKTY